MPKRRRSNSPPRTAREGDVSLNWPGKPTPESTSPTTQDPPRLTVLERFGVEPARGRLIHGDSRRVLLGLEAGSVDFIYADPPFLVGRDHHAMLGSERGRNARTTRAYSDRWRLDEYLTFLYELMHPLHTLLRASGLIAVHADHRAAPYVRLILDEIFGADRFVNELIWKYGLGNARATRHFARKHDNIAVYARSDKYYFKMIRGEVTRAQRQKYSHEDDRGRYMMSYGRKYYLKGGKPLDSVLDIPTLGATDRERTGYPTQKPTALLRTLIEAFCPEEGMTLDPCCGSGATAVAAEELSRRWIAIDRESLAIHMARKQLAERAASFTVESESSIDGGATVDEISTASPVMRNGVIATNDDPALDAWAIGRRTQDGYLRVFNWSGRTRRAPKLDLKLPRPDEGEGLIARQWNERGAWRDVNLQ